MWERIPGQRHLVLFSVVSRASFNLECTAQDENPQPIWPPYFSTEPPSFKSFVLVSRWCCLHCSLWESLLVLSFCIFDLRSNLSPLWPPHSRKSNSIHLSLLFSTVNKFDLLNFSLDIMCSNFLTPLVSFHRAASFSFAADRLKSGCRIQNWPHKCTWSPGCWWYPCL